jgi:hypothetical protein
MLQFARETPNEMTFRILLSWYGRLLKGGDCHGDQQFTQEVLVCEREQHMYDFASWLLITGCHDFRMKIFGRSVLLRQPAFASQRKSAKEIAEIYGNCRIGLRSSCE